MSNYAAYQQNQNATQNPRDIEYRLLGQVTAALVKADQHFSTANSNADHKKMLVDAVLWNNNVWSVFRVDLLDAGNQLPKELKAQLISLSLFVERETQAVMNGDADLEALIDINQQIIEGLRPRSMASAPMPDASQGAPVMPQQSVDSQA